ncbi:ATP-binding protein [Sporomusa sp.]|jgi:signal transduction histidine kinase|uniref:ATP-binding protein n=1 Tax=Sporomusa sp. TaxID=2078658 RepID=UPI002C1C1EFD|nr:ATP-binding protein [Sporomusa sp.]HWR06125.1 ATP-binding protein [Sporomusa sp.]
MLNRMRLNTQIMWLLTTTISVLMLLYLGWDSHILRKQALEDLHKSTAVLANQLLYTRIFIAQKQDLINKDGDGSIHFKNFNPSVAIRGISELFNGTMGYTFKQTGLKVRNPENSPDLFEIEMLQKLAGDRDLNEEWAVDTINDRKVFRYMLPLYYERDCLTCHGEPAGKLDIAGYPKEGSKLGDFAGAISIIAPMDQMEQNIHNMLVGRLLAVFTLWLTLTALIYLIIRKRFVQPLEHMTGLAQRIGSGNLEMRDVPAMANFEIQTLYDSFHAMAENLKELHDNLESKVSERTNELAAAYQTLQRHQQELQKINKKLAEASEVKSEFIATMSHELQTPLTSMIAYAEVILEYGTEKEEVTEYVYDIYQSAHHLLDLIRDILELSKIEKGKMQLHLTVFEIAEITAVLERILSPLINRNGLTCSIEIPEELPAIQADKNKVKQILMNLLSNAIKFTPAGGSVHVKVMYLDDEHTILVSVQDTGKGMSQNDISLIFGKFIQLDSGITKEYGGTGLGLAITKHLIELHGGTIWVESTTGSGSTFYFKLPIYQVPSTV